MSVSRHAIGYLRVLRDEGPAQPALPRVFCPRNGASVSLSHCARCPRFVKVSADGHECVHCHADAALPDVAPLRLPRVAVSSLMTRDVVAVRPELSLDALTRLFLETGLAAVPVIDERERLLGFVGHEEVALAVQLQAGPLTVMDVLMPFALAIPETASVTQAAAVLAFEGQQRLAVIALDGAVVGVLSASDVLYWLARSDGHMLPGRERA
jgi:CBS domain-containing protein